MCQTLIEKHQGQEEEVEEDRSKVRVVEVEERRNRSQRGENEKYNLTRSTFLSAEVTMLGNFRSQCTSKNI